MGSDTKPDSTENSQAINRRAALAKLARFGAYSAPVAVTLLSPSSHAHLSANPTFTSYNDCLAFHGGVPSNCSGSSGGNFHNPK